MVRHIILISLGVIFVSVSQFSVARETTKTNPRKKSNVISIETTIVGTKEQPKFLSIVPWRSLQDSNIGGAKLQYKLNKQLTAIEPNELQAQLKSFKKGQAQLSH